MRLRENSTDRWEAVNRVKKIVSKIASLYADGAPDAPEMAEYVKGYQQACKTIFDVISATDFDTADDSLIGTFACPICGKDTPHEHSREEVARYRHSLAAVEADP